MGAIVTTVLVVVALFLGWGAVEIACKPCMESGRAAINRSLDLDYDPDNEIANTPYQEAPSAPETNQEPGSPKKSHKVTKGETSDF
ncbi:uncharacterized protein [Physcomitrium patens]|uniref:Uncharacterized protein n=1 Tax=Physcomitrium patens TaxID=3218 RepID=A0A2K1JI14_PHYPA|nr:uncharacterized protein LOC112291267 [Physcomitrium patens]XP_024394202.1 uncharacterized protein LOC112291267 [Physcomitrium patens]XP_024394203.1 uncharacterized protein LOC112291267 [Physcomitrium patens]PNR40946.1 hypothetical protein PHYPA_018349 [Physcomitrium patens]|eukprot:XP_024394201.1 uncharacterized protein LOC112291267 [Physcomitrella patens]